MTEEELQKDINFKCQRAAFIFYAALREIEKLKVKAYTYQYDEIKDEYFKIDLNRGDIVDFIHNEEPK